MLMEETVYDPLERFKNEYAELFLQNAKNAFEELCQASQIDKKANQDLCLEIFNLTNEKDSYETSRSHWKWLRIFCWIAICGLLTVWGFTEDNLPGIICTIIAVGIGIFIFAYLNGVIRELDEVIENLESNIAEKKDAAYKIMQPLNEIFGWDIPAQIIHQTVPKLEFDPFFTRERLMELQNEFQYDNSLNENSSILFAHSGQINGNPFVIANSKTYEMGTETYTGHLTIYWSDWTIGANGKRQRVRRSQILTATVTKPCPRYGKVGFVIYGNEAAPKLEFTRRPSKLVEESFMQNFRRKRKLKELKKFSQNLKDDSQYTLMSNHEFETLFETKDRTDEVEYRLLFTALAQQQMLSLIKDKTVSYGDDFTFFKQKKINVIFPEHLTAANLDTNPAQFVDYDFNHCRQNFMQINQEYFRAVYFAMAPLLAIPLYQQMRTRKTIYRDVDKNKSSSWEWESIANYMGEEKFKPAKCATDCILKTELVSDDENGDSEIAVTAYGFQGIPQTDYVNVFGGDGRFHAVPVHWILYTPINKTTQIRISENVKEKGESHKIAAGEIYRRGIFCKKTRKL